VWSLLRAKHCQGDQRKANEIGGPCGTYVGEEREINDFGGNI
jgi:hypothetical protein